MKKWKKALLMGAEKAVKLTAGTTHIALKYAMDNVENNEALAMKLLWGVEEQQTIKERQVKTIHIQLDIKRKVNNIKEKISDYTIVFNKEASEITMYHEST